MMLKESELTRKQFFTGALKYGTEASLKLAAGAVAAKLLSVPTSYLLYNFLHGREKVSLSEEEEAMAQTETQVLENEPSDSNTLKEVEESPQAATETNSPSEAATGRVETGVELLDSLGLRDKVIYIVYGRPMGWGSLRHTQTAEESWEFYRQRKDSVGQEVGVAQKDFALNIINPVYDNEGYPLSDFYLDKTLELALGKQRLVALDFRSIEFARAAVERFETIFSKEKLAHLAISLDAEHFPQSQIDARAVNEFSAWFGQKHQQWSEETSLPGLVFVYVFPGSQILNLSELNQYYLDQKTLVVSLFDGYGTQGGKLYGMGGLVKKLTNTEEFPALLGVMEFNKEWGDRYDQCSVKQSFATLEGAPTFFFASQ